MKVSLKEPRNFKFGLPLIHIKELMLALFTLQIFFSFMIYPEISQISIPPPHLQGNDLIIAPWHSRVNGFFLTFDVFIQRSLKNRDEIEVLS